MITSYVCGLVLLGSPKSECEKALADAKKVGLPIQPSDLRLGLQSKDSPKISAVLARIAKISHRNMPSIGEMMADDFRQLDGKPRKLKDESNQQIELREADTLKAADELLSLNGLPSQANQGQSVFGQMNSFTSGAALTGLVRLELKAASKKGISVDRVGRHLNVAHKVLSFYCVDASFTSVMQQLAAERIYYAGVAKLAKEKPEVKALLTPALFAKPQRATIQQILRHAFINDISIWFKGGEIKKAYDKDGVMTGIPKPPKLSDQWKLPKDEGSLKSLTKLAKSYTIAYQELKGATSFADLEARYKKVSPKLSTSSYGDDKWKDGPNLCERATVMGRGEEARIATMKQLGILPR